MIFLQADSAYRHTTCTHVESMQSQTHMRRVEQNHTIIGIYGVHMVLLWYFKQEITIYTVIYGADIRFWPTHPICVNTYLNASQEAGVSREALYEGNQHLRRQSV